VKKTALSRPRTSYLFLMRYFSAAASGPVGEVCREYRYHGCVEDVGECELRLLQRIKILRGMTAIDNIVRD